MIIYKKAKYQDVKFKNQKELDKWLAEKTATIIHFKDAGQDLLKIWVDPDGEILHSNAQSDIWCCKFINTDDDRLREDGPISIWLDDKQHWFIKYALLIEKIERIHDFNSATTN